MIQVWGLLTILSLVGPSVGLQPWKLDFCSETELSHLVVDETLAVVYLGAAGVIYPLMLGKCLKCSSLSKGAPTNLATVT